MQFKGSPGVASFASSATASSPGLHLVRLRFDTRSIRLNEPSLECRVKRVLDTFGVRWVQVPVAVHGHDDARVPKVLSHDLRVQRPWLMSIEAAVCRRSWVLTPSRFVVSEAIALLLSTAAILLLAHTYSAVMAERAIDGHSLGVVRRHLIVTDNLPVVAATIVPTAFLVLAGMDVITLRAAYDASIAFNLIALFGIGLYEGRASSMGWFHSTVSGLAAGAIGIVVVVIEAFFD